MATKKSKTKSSSRSEKKDAISLLKGDHKIVQDLLQKLITSSGRQSKSLDTILSRVEQEMKGHTTVEEEIFYPAFKDCVRKKDDQKLYFEAREEHHVVDVVMEEFHEGVESKESLAAKCKLLKELIEHHIEEEERTMFPLAKKLMDKEMLRDLGERIEERKQEILSGVA